MEIQPSIRKHIKIENYPIKLGQFLKLTNTVSDGIEAKIRILNGDVLLNGDIEIRRGKKLIPGDEIKIDGQIYTCS